MKTTDTFTLENGLRVFYSVDRSKHYFQAELGVRFGGITSGFKLDGKKYNVPGGTAHLMEHMLIDKSIYGNMFRHMQENYVRFNGVTSEEMTKFYINTVENYEEIFKKFLNFIYRPVFTDKDLEETKLPVFEEIKKTHDNRWRNIYLANKKCLYKEYRNDDTIGNEESVKSIDSAFLSLCHKVFYRPENQILLLAGNVDIEKIREILESFYKELKLENVSYEIIKLDEPNEINKKRKVIIDNKNEEYVSINFKINLDNFTPFEKVKLSFYLPYFLRYNFDDSSELYTSFVEKNYAIYSIERTFDFFDKFLIITIGCFTNKADLFEKEVLNIMNSAFFDEEEFLLYQKNTIVSIILRNENSISLLYPFAANVNDFKYPKMDTIEDVESLSIEEFLTLFKAMDFSQYTVVVRKNEDEEKK